MELLTYRDHFKEYTFYLDKNGNEVIHGTYKCWYDSGQLWSCVFMYHGRWHGEFRTWGTRGEISGRCFYIRDKHSMYIEMTNQEKLLFQIQHPGFRFFEE